MNTSVVLVPGAPVLVPELAGDAARESREHVDRTIRMLRTAAVGARGVEVRGVDPLDRPLPGLRSSLRRWGVDVEVGPGGGPVALDEDVPDAALLGWWFLDRAGVEVPRSFAPVDRTARGTRGGLEDRDGLEDREGRPVRDLVVVVADGPASLTPRAPIPERPDGIALDAALTRWLGETGPLPDPGEETAREVGWWSRPAWFELVGLVGDRPAEEYVSWAPFGVGYHSARWETSSSSSPSSGGPR